MTDYTIHTITADAMNKSTIPWEVESHTAIKGLASVDPSYDLDLIAWYYVGEGTYPVACDWMTSRSPLAPSRVGASSSLTLTFWRDHEGAWNVLDRTVDPSPYHHGEGPGQQPPQPVACTQCGQHTFTQRTGVTIKPDHRWLPGTPVPTLSSTIDYYCDTCGTSFVPYKDAEGRHWTSHP